MSVFLPAGILRHRIAIEYPQEVQTESGFTSTPEPWPVFASVRASIEPLSGNELWRAQQVQSEATHRLRIRYLRGLNSQMRVRFCGRVFEILSVVDLEERRIEHVLMCKEHM